MPKLELLRDTWRHHLPQPPQSTHGTGGEGNILQHPSPVIFAAIPHKTFRPTDLTSTYSERVKYLVASSPGPPVRSPIL
ncbi:hypothetical protein TNCV_4366011 [Trichonephila clavipes]|nr:hypothetical protein TNCV_4366011 [Trichonephila clavipes]